jgi:hypothetical protein
MGPVRRMEEKRKLGKISSSAPEGLPAEKMVEDQSDPGHEGERDDEAEDGADNRDEKLVDDKEGDDSADEDNPEFQTSRHD